MRSILCQSCSATFTMHPQDAADSWHMRKVNIKTNVPTDGSHRITVMSSDGAIVRDTPVPIIVCDHCNCELPDGTDAVAVSMWRGQNEPDNWEQNYNQQQPTTTNANINC